MNLGVIYALISAAGFGFLGVLGALGRVHGFTNSTLLAWRFMGAAAILGGISWWRSGIPRFEARPFLLGLAGYSLQSLLFFKTIERLGPGKATILLYTYPTLIALLNWLRYKQRPTRAHLAVLAVTTAGCLLVLYSNQGEFSLVGVVLGLATAFVYSLYLVASEQILKRIGAMTASFHVALGTGISMMLLSALEPSHSFPTTASQWGVIAGLIVLCTVLPALALFSAIRRIGSAKTALCSTIEPMIAVVLSTLIFAEDLAPHQILGGAMVVSSITIIYLSGSKDSRHPARTTRSVVMNTEDIEKKVREFLTEEMLKEQAAVAASSDPLDFDSLEQTEIRVYLEEEFGADVKNLNEPFGSIGQIVDFVHSNRA